MKDFIYILQATDNNGFQSIINVYTDFYQLQRKLRQHANNINHAGSLTILCYQANQFTPNAVYALPVYTEDLESQRDYQAHPLKRLNEIGKQRNELLLELNSSQHTHH